MNTCQNPECGKEIPEEKHYCNEDYLRKHLQIKRNSKKDFQYPLQYWKTKQNQTRMLIQNQLKFLRNQRTTETISEMKRIFGKDRNAEKEQWKQSGHLLKNVSQWTMTNFLACCHTEQDYLSGK